MGPVYGLKLTVDKNFGCPSLKIPHRPIKLTTSR